MTVQVYRLEDSVEALVGMTNTRDQVPPPYYGRVNV